MILNIKFLLFLVISVLYTPVLIGWFFAKEVPHKPFLLMIEASGDSAHPGRIIDENFESTLSFTVAQALKNKLLALNPTIKVILNRAYDERILSPAQNANFANKLDVDLYISLHAFYETEAAPRIYLYQFSYHDNVIIKDNALTFYPWDKIYLANENKTNTFAQDLKKQLSNNPTLTTLGVYKIPFKPLIGLKSPAIGIEIGIKNNADWAQYSTILADSITAMIKDK